MEALTSLWNGSTLLQCLFTTLIGYLTLVIVQSFFPVARWRYRHIPGPPPSWLTGNTLEVMQKYDILLFHAWDDWCLKYGRVFKWFWGPQPVITVRDAEMAKAICVKHFKTFPDRSMFYPPLPQIFNKVLSAGITFAKGSYWLSLRAALQPLFHSQGLQSYCGVVDKAVEELSGSLEAAAAAGDSVDMNAAISNLTLKAIGEAAFGVPFSTMQQERSGQIRSNILVQAAHYAMEKTGVMLQFMVVPELLKPPVYALVRMLPIPVLKKLNECRCQLYMASLQLAKNSMERLGLKLVDDLGMFKAFGKPCAEVVKQEYAMRVPAEGSVVDLLVRAKNKETGEPLKLHQIVAQSNSILVAGHDTTAFMLTSALYHLSRNPDAKAKLLKEIDAFGRSRRVEFEDLEKFSYAEAVLYETLRLNPSGWMTTRECLEDITIEGWYIPKGSVVYVDIRGIHRDPTYWKEPLSFRPERFSEKETSEYAAKHPYAFLGFGAGPRTCIGYKFAMQEAKLALIGLYQRWDFVYDEGCNGGPEPRLRPGITMGYRNGVWMRPELRKGSQLASHP